MHLKDAMNRDVTTIPDAQLKEATQALVRNANRRIRNLKDRMLNTPALRGLGKKDVFNIKGINPNTKRGRERMEREFIRAKNFLSARTSTVRGAMSTTREIQKKLHIKQDVKQWTKEDTDSFYEVLNEMEERCPNLVYKLADSDIAKIIMQKVHNQTKRNPGMPINWMKVRTNTLKKIRDYKRKQGEADLDKDIWTKLSHTTKTNRWKK